MLPMKLLFLNNIGVGFIKELLLVGFLPLIFRSLLIKITSTINVKEKSFFKMVNRKRF